MTTYIIRRLLQALIVLILVTLLVFFVMRLLPGDPLLIYMAKTSQMEAMSQEMLDKLRHEFGLDKPIILQYVNWMGNIFRGDFGTSLFYHEQVRNLMVAGLTPG